MNEGKNPMSLFLDAHKNDQTVCFNLRNNRKMICNIVAYNKHFNCLLKNVIEVGKGRNQNKGIKKREGFEYEKALGNVYLRGDNIISITKIN